MNKINLVYPHNNWEAYKFLVYCWSCDFSYAQTKLELEQDYKLTITERMHKSLYQHLENQLDEDIGQCFY